MIILKSDEEIEIHEDGWPNCRRMSCYVGLHNQARYHNHGN